MPETLGTKAVAGVHPCGGVGVAAGHLSPFPFGFPLQAQVPGIPATLLWPKGCPKFPVGSFLVLGC